MKSIRAIILILGLTTLSSCFDLYETRHEIDGPYYVASDPARNGQSLWYAIDKDSSIGRLHDIKRVGHTNTFIIAETTSGYYFINKHQDSKYKNGADVIGEPMDYEGFRLKLDSLKIQNFKFDYYLSK